MDSIRVNFEFEHSLNSLVNYATYGSLSVAEKKKKLIKLKRSLVDSLDEIVYTHIKANNVSEQEFLYFEFHPILKSIKEAYNSIATWGVGKSSPDKDIYDDNKLFNVYCPKGVVCLFLDTPLSFYYLFASLISSISAGNKIVIHLINMDKNIVLLVKELLGLPIFVNDIVIASEMAEIKYSINKIKYDYYYAISTKKSFDTYLSKINFSKISFLNIDDYISISIIDEKYKVEYITSSLLNSTYLYNGKLFFDSRIIFIHNKNKQKLLNQINKIIKNTLNEATYQSIINGLKTKCYFDDGEHVVKLNNATKELLKNLKNTYIYEGEFNVKEKYIMPAIIEITNIEELTYWHNQSPIVYVVPFFYDFGNLLNIIKHIPRVDKINLFTEDQNNMQIIFDKCNFELCMINDFYAYRSKSKSIFAEGGMYYKDYGGYINFSSCKSIVVKEAVSYFEKINELKTKLLDVLKRKK